MNVDAVDSDYSFAVDSDFLFHESMKKVVVIVIIVVIVAAMVIPNSAVDAAIVTAVVTS